MELIPPTKAMGGRDALRGVPLLLFRGNCKLVFSPELRLHLFEFGPLFDEMWRFELVGFTDIGNAWPALGQVDLRQTVVTGGAGLRLYWGKDFCAILDVGFWQMGPRFFLDTEQLF